VLTESAVKEIIESKESLVEYVTVAMVQAIAVGLVRIQDDRVSPAAISSLLDTMRKVRADLTGDGKSADVPQMMVNIQFNKDSQPVEISGREVLDRIPEKVADEREQH